ncbi:MAG TPA: phosphate ABC transporter substrate-binding protein [Xanthobacteraceae bacterium]
MSVQQITRLRAALGDYAHTMPLKNKEIASQSVVLDFSEIQPVYKVFPAMVRERAFDVSEMAIVTYLQAKSYGKPLVLLPAVMMGRFQHNCMLYNAERGRIMPADLPGRRVGVRSFAQTTGVWLRGHLQNDYGVDPAKVHWVTFEDAHVNEFRDPPGVERAGPGANLTKMVLGGELAAAIYGQEFPDDKRLQSVVPDPDDAVRQWHARHGVVPLNHMVVVTEELARTRPQTVREVYRMLLASKKAAGLPKPGGLDMHPFGLEACRPALKMIIDYCAQQKLIPRRFEVEELFDDTTRALGA